MRSITLLILSYFLCVDVQAQSGTLNYSFGDSGKVITGYKKTDLEGFASAMQNDNKTVVAGKYYYQNGDSFSDGFLVLRYLPDGKLDNRFGNKGRVVINFGYDARVAYAVAIDTDGKIMVTGYGLSGFFDPLYAVLTARLTPNGTLDSSFGSNGKVITDLYYKAVGNAIIVQSNGKIIVGGSYRSLSSFLLRYNTNGVLDSSFGNDGKVIDANPNTSTIVSIAIRPDGKILTGGGRNGSNVVFAIGRYNTNGSVDSTFGMSGFVYIQCSEYSDHLSKVVLQPDGKIIAVGRTGLFTSHHKDQNIVAVRYKQDGRLDSNYGKSGISTIKFSKTSSSANAAVLQADNKLVIAGHAYGDYALVRLKTNGNIDSGFGTNGFAVTDFGFSDIPYGVGIRSDDVIVVAGCSQQYEKDAIFDVSLAAYQEFDEKKASQNDVITSSGINTPVGQALNVLIYPNPVKNSLHVEGLPSNKTKLTVVDFSGNIKMQTTVYNSNYNLNTAQLKAGNFLLKIEINDEVVKKKFVKE